MKKVPLIAGSLTAIFLTLCLFQLRGRGMGFAPPLTDWELNPAWWHFNLLADFGEYLVGMPAFFIILLEAQVLTVEDSERWPEFYQTILTWLPFVIPIVIESLLVYGAANLCMSLISNRTNNIQSDSVK